ncbi:hypothetical protein [Desulfonema magnum]|uniref:Uncharacterized protein n=1 Tax=Desulfonema magnum TaxID=45655 RepID=A0A975BHW7_9BACT|nr:hypothetical protein [Desulfonema magnum]QTA85580.1 Uncharacterized protein dnm_015910 [Desulfonema magnum]
MTKNIIPAKAGICLARSSVYGDDKYNHQLRTKYFCQFNICKISDALRL